MSEKVKKKCVVVRLWEQPYFVCDIKEVSTLEFLNLEKECKKNRALLKNNQDSQQSELLNRINQLEQEIKILKGED